MTINEYYNICLNKLITGDYTINVINKKGDINDTELPLHAVDYILYEYLLDHSDERYKLLFDFILVPNNVNKVECDIDFTNVEFDELLIFMVSAKTTDVKLKPTKQPIKTVKKVTKDVPKPTTKKSILMEKVKILEEKLETLKEQMKKSILEIKSEISLLKTEISNMEDVETKPKPSPKVEPKVEKVEQKVEKKVEQKIENNEPYTNTRSRGKYILGQYKDLDVELTITDKKSELRYNDDVYKLPLNLSYNIELKDAIEYINNEILLDETLSNLDGIKFSYTLFGQSINNVKMDNNIKENIIKLCKNKNKYDNKQLVDEIKNIINN